MTIALLFKYLKYLKQEKFMLMHTERWWKLLLKSHWCKLISHIRYRGIVEISKLNWKQSCSGGRFFQFFSFLISFWHSEAEISLKYTRWPCEHVLNPGPNMRLCLPPNQIKRSIGLSANGSTVDRHVINNLFKAMSEWRVLVADRKTDRPGWM